MVTILEDVKSAIGIDPEETAFDDTIRLYLSGAFAELVQLGVVPTTFDDWSFNFEWSTVLTGSAEVQMARVYCVVHLRLTFDTPSTGFLTTSLEKQKEELKWRLISATSH